MPTITCCCSAGVKTGEDKFCEIRWRQIVVVVRVVEAEGNNKNNNNPNILATYEYTIR